MRFDPSVTSEEEKNLDSTSDHGPGLSHVSLHINTCFIITAAAATAGFTDTKKKP